MSNLPRLKSRLRSMGGLESVLEAMMLVSAVEVQKMKHVHQLAQNYFGKVERLMEEVGVKFDRNGKDKVGKTLLVLIVSNKGLCASFNSLLHKKAYSFFDRAQGEVELLILGRKGLEFKTRGHRAEYAYSYSYEPSFEKSSLLAERLMQRFEQEWDEVYIGYNKYHSFIYQQPTIERLMPFVFPGKSALDECCYFEPEQKKYKAELAKLYFRVLLHKIIIESDLGEVSTRMFTLKGATDKSKDMLSELSLMINKERQAMINRELAEIASTFEILREES